MIVDLGCGDAKRGDIGIDRVPLPGVDLVCDLGFEPIPLPDDHAEAVVAYDFLEHLPGPISWREGGRWHHHNPRIHLLREVHRILRPGGTFFSHTPAYEPLDRNLPEGYFWAQDPTHAAPPWTLATWKYFCGEYAHLNARYGIDFAFELVSAAYHDGYLDVTVRKPALR